MCSHVEPIRIDILTWVRIGIGIWSKLQDWFGIGIGIEKGFGICSDFGFFEIVAV
jgi:hypothetical protein